MRRSTFCAATCSFAAAAIARPARPAPAIADLNGRTGIPVVRARRGSRVLRLAIDTGTPFSTISPAVAAEIAPQGGLVAGAQVTLTGISVGGAVLHDHRAVTGDVGELSRAAGVTLDGALGYGAFRDRAVTIDYGGGRLTFPDALPDGESAPITWLHDGDAPPLITFDGLTVDGFPAVAQFDTMTTKNAIVFARKLPDLAIDNEQRAPLYTYAQAQLGPGRVGSLRLGATLLGAHPIVYVADARVHSPASAIAIVVGDSLFVKRAVTLDFPGSLLVVT